MADSKNAKQVLRERTAAKSFAEKVRILEKLRERDRAIMASSRLTRGEKSPRKA